MVFLPRLGELPVLFFAGFQGCKSFREHLKLSILDLGALLAGLPTSAQRRPLLIQLAFLLVDPVPLGRRARELSEKADRGERGSALRHKERLAPAPISKDFRSGLWEVEADAHHRPT